MKNWFVATTKHQQEIRAAGELREQNFRVYLPKRHLRIPAGRRVEVVSQLRFSGYIFVEFDLAKQEHGPINNTRSIGSLICRTETIRHTSGEVERKEVPSRLPPNWEIDMRRHEDEEWEIATGKAKPDPRADLKHGDLVRIALADHPFNMQQGEYSRTEHGMAVVHVGFAICKVPEIHLLRMEPQERAA